MANTCNNHLIFSGKGSEVISEIFKSMIQRQQIENKGVLPPMINESMFNKYFFDIHFNGGQVNFETRWSPPIEEIKELSKIYGGVDFELYYEELGSLEYGAAFFIGGKLQHIFLTTEEIETVDMEHDDSNITLSEILDEKINKFRNQ